MMITIHKSVVVNQMGMKKAIHMKTCCLEKVNIQKYHGVSFTEIGDSCVVSMRLDNGSVASLMLTSGLITAYKAHMWHGSTLEVLHTIVSEGEGGAAVIQGGMFEIQVYKPRWSPMVTPTLGLSMMWEETRRLYRRSHLSIPILIL
ncbi:hypothetical protein IFM89_019513 [Coptis chinensis]|uniref:Uncharacterized protein n=1 Tax=Coptis chinensis TaxID=261450 RepID=A0A835I5C9_9MAGN|nr:hypothetical protein IFM89_019513 [Coptis chinensis]